MKTKTNKWKIKEEKRVQKLLKDFNNLISGINLEDYRVGTKLEAQQNVGDSPKKLKR